MAKGKCFIFSAPSGAGKTTIVHHLLAHFPELSFSVSAASRAQRPNEIDGKDYHFLGLELFKQRIKEDAFIEWEEVYSNQYYGTLKSEIDRIWEEGKHVIFDVDVVGGLNLKKHFGNDALAVFVKPPSEQSLEERLRSRNTESEEQLERRISKAAFEMQYEPKFDLTLINDQLDVALKEAEDIVRKFLAL